LIWRQLTQVDFVLAALELEAITVTAMKREEQLINVPLSIAAPTEQALRVRGVDNIEQVAQNVAGFSVQNLGPGQSQPAIRGASSGQISRDQPGVKEDVGAYLDESVVSLSLFTPDLDLFDVGRVEVLRGPQGTLFGSGSFAGTVRYITNQPEQGVSRTFGEAGVTAIDGGDPGSTAKLGFNAPLGDKAAFRVVAYSTRTGGWIDAVRPDPLGGGVSCTVEQGVKAEAIIQPLQVEPTTGNDFADQNGELGLLVVEVAEVVEIVFAAGQQIHGQDCSGPLGGQGRFEV